MSIGNLADADPGRRVDFWQDRAFVRVFAYAPEEAATLEGFAGNVSRALPSGGRPPSLVEGLPGEGLVAVDGGHGRFYSGGEGADRVRIYDSDRLQQTGVILTEAEPVADAYHGELFLVQQGIYLTSLDTYTITAAIADTLPQNPGFSPNPTAIGAAVDVKFRLKV